MPEDVRALWNHKTKDWARCVAITNDGRFVVAGSRDGHIYFLRREDGRQLWRANIEGDVLRVALAEAHQRILTGAASGTTYKASLWNYDGQCLQTYQTDGTIFGVDITPNADLIALSTSKHTLYLFDAAGPLLWKRQVGDVIRRVSITPDGRYIAAGSDDRNIYVFDQAGEERWHYTTGARVFTGAAIDATAEHLVAGSNDFYLYLLDRNGQLLWKYKTGGNVNITVLTPDGRYIAAAGTAQTVFLLRHTGELLWSYQASADIYGLAISFDGQFVVAGTNDYQIYLFNSEGRCIWRQKTKNQVQSVALTPNGRLFAAASLDYHIYLFENLTASDDFSSSWLARTIIRRIRAIYIENPHQGVAAWFDEFDRTLRQREFAGCRALLKEIREQGYILDEEEHGYVNSREGALLLCQGISHHQRGECEQATEKCEQSLQLQTRLGHAAGKAQSASALEEVRKQQQGDTRVLRLILSDPRVLSNSHELLARRITLLEAAEQLQVIIAAKHSGYLNPLVKALHTDASSVQASAAAALRWLTTGPEYNTLLDMLSSPNWIVRWQSALMLQQRAKDRTSEFAQHSPSIREALTRCLVNNELDPNVRRVIVQLLSVVGEPSDTAQLIKLLDDKDAGVRIAVAEALSKIGDRTALPMLRQTEDGKDFEGNTVQKQVTQAIQHIEERYLIFEVKKISLCREITAEKKPIEPATVFLEFEGQMHCVVTVSLPQPNTRVTCYWRERGRSVSQQETAIDDVSSSAPSLVEILSTSARQQGTAASTDIDFVWSPPRGRWLPGRYSVQVALNGVEQEEQFFDVINYVTILEAKTCLAVESDGPHFIELPVFPATIPSIYCIVTLNEAPIGIEVLGDVYHTETNTLVERKTAKTETEGRQVRVILSYSSAQWAVGEYSVVLRTATGNRTNTKFNIIPTDLFMSD